MDTKLERNFRQPMIDVHRVAGEIECRATVFLGMVQGRGGLASAMGFRGKGAELCLSEGGNARDVIA